MKSHVLRRTAIVVLGFVVLSAAPTRLGLGRFSYADAPPLCGPSGLIKDAQLGPTCEKARQSAWSDVMDDLEVVGRPKTSEAVALRAAAFYAEMQLWSGDRIRSQLPSDAARGPLLQWLAGLRTQAEARIDEALQAKYDAGKAAKCDTGGGIGGGIHDAVTHGPGGSAGVHNGHLADRAETP